MFEKARNMSIYKFSEEPDTRIVDIKPRARLLASKFECQNIVALRFGSVRIELNAYFDDVYLIMNYYICCEVDKGVYKSKIDGCELKRLEWEDFDYSDIEVGSLSDNLELEMFNVLMLECKKHNFNWNENIKFDEFKELRDLERDRRKKSEGIVVLTDHLDESEFTDK